jgi:hypothetical protein
MKKMMMLLLFFSAVSTGSLLAQSGSCAKACAKACATADVKNCPPGCKPGDPDCEIKSEKACATSADASSKIANYSNAQAVNYDPFSQSNAKKSTEKACCNAPKAQATTAAKKPAKTALIASVDKK